MVINLNKESVDLRKLPVWMQSFSSQPPYLLDSAFTKQMSYLVIMLNTYLFDELFQQLIPCF